MSRLFISSLLALLSFPALAAVPERALLAREAVLYLNPDAASQKLANVGRGREVAIIEKSNDWLHVLANVEGERDVTGWMRDKGVIRTSTPKGDEILFGEAVDSEMEASRRGGRKGADKDAMRLYYRLAEYFPQSPRAGEALYRAADIRWQLEKLDLRGRPSARQNDPVLRREINNEWMREVRKKFPNTRWADLASFAEIDNKLCADWTEGSKCPEKEAEQYENYAKEHPQSPKTAESLYEAARRRAALIEIYKTEGKSDRSGESRARATALAQRIASEFAQTDWSPRAQALLYKLQQNIPTYGNNAE